MSGDVTEHDWKLCLRVLKAWSRDEWREQKDERWKTLLNSLHGKLRKEAKRTGTEPWEFKPKQREPGCIPTLRLLAMSVENRLTAVASSSLRPTVRILRNEIRLDLRSERSTHSFQPSAEQGAVALKVLQFAKTSPKEIPDRFRAELADVIHRIWHQARRDSRRRRIVFRPLNAADCQACERELRLLCGGLHPDGDFRVFKGLLAKVERAFEKDIHQGRSSVEERRHHMAEDAGSSPAGPDQFKEPQSRAIHWGRPKPTVSQYITSNARPTWLQRFFRWIRPR